MLRLREIERHRSWTYKWGLPRVRSKAMSSVPKSAMYTRPNHPPAECAMIVTFPLSGKNVDRFSQFEANIGKATRVRKETLEGPSN